MPTELGTRFFDLGYGKRTVTIGFRGHTYTIAEIRIGCSLDRLHITLNNGSEWCIGGEDRCMVK